MSTSAERQARLRIRRKATGKKRCSFFLSERDVLHLKKLASVNEKTISDFVSSMISKAYKEKNL